MDAPAGLMFDTSPADFAPLEPAAPRMHDDFEIEVAVLGPIEIRGANKLDRRRPRELIAYLAMHTEGATDERLKTILWPDKAPTAGTFNTTVSMARTALGLNRNGELHFPHIGSTGKDQLAESVTTDLARFEAMIDSARSVASTEQMDVLRSGPGPGPRRAVRRHRWLPLDHYRRPTPTPQLQSFPTQPTPSPRSPSKPVTSNWSNGHPGRA